MSYIPGAGIKKPLGVIELPIYPDIKRGPPRFVNAKKYWKVDVGATMRDTEHNTQLIENAVLVQPRDYNKTRYGISSHKDVVNKAFRPPLITMEDHMPLSRLPRPIAVPRTNPSTVSDGGTSGYLAFNPRPNNIQKGLTNRIKNEQYRPTFYYPMDMPVDNSVLPDLPFRTSTFEPVASGHNFPPIDAPIPDVELNFQRNVVPVKSQKNYVPMNGRIRSDYELADDSPYVPIDPVTNIQVDAPAPLANLALDNQMPTPAIKSGVNTFVQRQPPTPFQEMAVLNKMNESVIPTRVRGEVRMQDFSDFQPPQDSYAMVREIRPRTSFNVNQNGFVNVPTIPPSRTVIA